MTFESGGTIYANGLLVNGNLVLQLPGKHLLRPKLGSDRDHVFCYFLSK